MSHRHYFTVGTLLVGGVAACTHRIHSATPEERGAWVVEKVSKKLELNAAQKSKLVELKNEVLAVRKSMRSDREQNRAEMLAMLKQPTLDRQKVNSMVQQKIDQLCIRLSNATGHNLVPWFQTFRFPLSPGVPGEVSHLPPWDSAPF